MSVRHDIKTKRETLSLAYAGVQASYWMSFCVSVSFASVYLQGLGYTNTQLGAVIAGGSMAGALLGPFLATAIDGSKRFTAARLTPPVLLAQLVTLIFLLLFPRRGAVTTVSYALYLALCAAMNTLDLKLYADASHRGQRVDYGFARGMGSLAFVLLSLLLGAAVDRSSVRVLPVVGLFLCFLQFGAFLPVARRVSAGPPAGEQTRSASLAAFLRSNRRFCVMLVGTALLFFSHNIVTNFLINVVRNVGGDTGTMGFLNAFMAATEIPVMLLYSRLSKGKDQAAILRVSFIAFSVKAFALALAGSIPALTASFLLQAPSFALYTAAIVPYVEETVRYEDSAKAQSLAYTMTTVGVVLASIFGGRLYDVTTVTNTLWAAGAVSVAGSVMAICGTGKMKKTEL